MNSQKCEEQARTGPAGHRKIPGGPVVAIKIYYINKLIFLAKMLDNVGRPE